MENFIKRSYYAIVWNTSLKRRKKIRGKLIDGNVVLPKETSILYGTSDNDIAKVRTVDYKDKVVYNIETGKQSVQFEKDVREFVLNRDVRLIIWDGPEYLNPLKDKYKIIEPRFFEEMVLIRKELEDKGFDYEPPIEQVNLNEEEMAQLGKDFEFEIFEFSKFFDRLRHKESRSVSELA